MNSTKLKFYAKGAGLVRQPGVIELVGTDPHYVGRAKLALPNGRFCYPAIEDAFEVDAGSEAGQRLCHLTRFDASLWPADKETAAACQVNYVPVEYNDGEWLPSASLSGRKSKAQ